MSVWQLLSELGFPADRAHHQNIYLQGTLRLDVLYFLFQCSNSQLLNTILSHRAPPSEFPSAYHSEFITAFATLSQLLGLVDVDASAESIIAGIPNSNGDEASQLAILDDLAAPWGGIGSTHGMYMIKQQAKAAKLSVQAQQHRNFLSNLMGSARARLRNDCSEQYHKCVQLATTVAEASSLLFSDDARLFPSDIPASMSLHRTRTAMPLVEHYAGKYIAIKPSPTLDSLSRGSHQTSSVQQCQQTLNAAVDECRRACASLQAQLSGQSNVKLPGDVPIVTHVHSQAPVLHDRIRDFNRRWRSSWASRVAPSDAKPAVDSFSLPMSSSSHTKSEPDSDGLENQEIDTFNTSGVGSAQVKVQQLMNKIQSVWTHADTVRSNYAIVEPHSLVADLAALQKAQLAAPIIDRLEREIECQSAAVQRRREEVAA